VEEVEGDTLVGLQKGEFQVVTYDVGVRERRGESKEDREDCGSENADGDGEGRVKLTAERKMSKREWLKKRLGGGTWKTCCIVGR
jgi:hypothetical protein